ncbi:MAG: cobyric acid synthase [Cohaesibacter sp.]|nr:cobyric acid synthase [Cohaesibacter sp.]MCV6602128.1 cobyric acid synthase [Cohaesibacter sp.]
MTAAIMLQGTGSNVGKSMLVAGLCRALLRRGFSVAPFKPQNMSNNAAVTEDGGEIGRAQALQAMACKLKSSVDMNPVLLKPQSNIGSQVVVQGKVIGQMKARDYATNKGDLLASVLESYERLKAQYDIVVVEGAGSASEVNLRAGDIANMGFAQAANVPVILVGDIDRGGVIASIVGTKELLPDEDLRLVKGYLINKFRGDVSLFDSGVEIISNKTSWPSLGVVPWFDQAARLPAEDSEDLKRDIKANDKNARANAGDKENKKVRILVPILPRIANFDDLDALRADPDILLEMIEPGAPLPQGADLILLIGSKTTIADFEFLKSQGWDIDILSHHRQGGSVMGLCGGYQMLGASISDPDGVETEAGSQCEGLGLLDVETILAGQKRTIQVSGTHLQSGESVKAYEIHIGQTDGEDRNCPIFEIEGVKEGAQSSDGRVMGTYLHGLFNEDAFRAAFFSKLGGSAQISQSYHQMVEDSLEALADHVERHMDVDAMIALAKQGL